MRAESFRQHVSLETTNRSRKPVSGTSGDIIAERYEKTSNTAVHSISGSSLVDFALRHVRPVKRLGIKT
jgi:hypothetical protein